MFSKNILPPHILNDQSLMPKRGGGMGKWPRMGGHNNLGGGAKDKKKSVFKKYTPLTYLITIKTVFTDGAKRVGIKQYKWLKGGGGTKMANKGA